MKARRLFTILLCLVCLLMNVPVKGLTGSVDHTTSYMGVSAHCTGVLKAIKITAAIDLTVLENEQHLPSADYTCKTMIRFMLTESGESEPWYAEFTSVVGNLDTSLTVNNYVGIFSGSTINNVRLRYFVFDNEVYYRYFS